MLVAACWTSLKIYIGLLNSLISIMLLGDKKIHKSIKSKILCHFTYFLLCILYQYIFISHYRTLTKIDI